jgi:hypothetical protein
VTAARISRYAWTLCAGALAGLVVFKLDEGNGLAAYLTGSALTSGLHMRTY